MVAGRQAVVHLPVAPHEPVHHAEHEGGVEVEHDGVVLGLHGGVLAGGIGQGQHVPLGQGVEELVEALLLDGLHLHLADGVQPGVDAGGDDAGVVLKDAVEHFQVVLGELPGTVKVILPVFLLLLVRALLGGGFAAALHGTEQGVDLALG